jgi:hypothetical protein
MQLHGRLAAGPSARPAGLPSAGISHKCTSLHARHLVAPARAAGDGDRRSAPVATSSNDPEAKFRRYGPAFGQPGFRLDPMQWLNAAPRVRIRTEESRKMEDLMELVLLNERLAGTSEPWETRQRLEHMRMHRRNWELIYEYVISKDVAATLEVIEEASRKVTGVQGAWSQL